MFLGATFYWDTVYSTLVLVNEEMRLTDHLQKQKDFA